jgi:hypothetical protein
VAYRPPALDTKDIVPSAEPGALQVFALSGSKVGWMTLALLWVAAAFFLVQMARATSKNLAHGIRGAALLK